MHNAWQCVDSKIFVIINKWNHFHPGGMEGCPCEPKETVVMKHKEYWKLSYKRNLEQGIKETMCIHFSTAYFGHGLYTVYGKQITNVS